MAGVMSRSFSGERFTKLLNTTVRLGRSQAMITYGLSASSLTHALEVRGWSGNAPDGQALAIGCYNSCASKVEVNELCDWLRVAEPQLRDIRSGRSKTTKIVGERMRQWLDRKADPPGRESCPAEYELREDVPDHDWEANDKVRRQYCSPNNDIAPRRRSGRNIRHL